MSSDRRALSFEKDVGKPLEQVAQTLKPYQGLSIKPVKHPSAGYEFYAHVTDGFELRKTKTRGIGLFTSKKVKKGTALPYLGKPETEEQAAKLDEGEDDYLFKVPDLQVCYPGKTQLNGDPRLAKVGSKNAWVISMASFANEPDKGEKANAKFVDAKLKCNEETVYLPRLELVRNVPANTEVLVNYGRTTIEKRR